MKYFLAVSILFHMVQLGNCLSQKHVVHDTQDKVDEEFGFIARTVQNEQFTMVRSTPFPSDFKDGQMMVYFSTRSEHPILYLRAGASTYIFRSEPYFK